MKKQASYNHIRDTEFEPRKSRRRFHRHFNYGLGNFQYCRRCCFFRITGFSQETTSDDDASSSDASSIDWVGTGIWVVGGAVIVVLLIVLLMVLNSEEEDDTPDWSEGGYEDNLTATYGAVAAAPNVGSMEKSIPEISPPQQVLRLLFKQVHLFLQKGCQKDGLWSNGAIMVNSGWTTINEIHLRWVESRVPLGWSAEVFTCMEMDKHQSSF